MNSHDAIEREATSQPISAPRDRCIYALIRHPGIASRLRQWAECHDCSIWWGDPDSGSEIVAVPCFAIVVDRRLLSREAWDFYVAFAKEVNDGEDMVVNGELIDCSDDTVCILLDDIDDWPLPRLSCVIRLSDAATDTIEKWLEPCLVKALQEVGRSRGGPSGRDPSHEGDSDGEQAPK